MTPTGSTALWNGLTFPPCSAAVFENSSKIVIVMEYASRGDLYDYISERPRLSEQDARHFFRQIVSAVHYCHLVSSPCQLSSEGVPGALGLSRIPQGDKQRQKLIWTWALGMLASLAVAPGVEVSVIRGPVFSRDGHSQPTHATHAGPPLC